MINFKIELTIGEKTFCYPKKDKVNFTPSVTIKGSDLIIAFNRPGNRFDRNS